MPTCKAWKDIAPSTSARKQDPQAFWGEIGRTEIDWFREMGHGPGLVESAVRQMVFRREDERILQLPRPASQRHRAATRPRSSSKANRATSGSSRYAELHTLVCRFANVLKARGFKAGDRSIIYMPMIPEAARRDAGMRAARHHPQRGVRRILGRSAESSYSGSRMRELVITADGGWRRGKEVRLKPAVDEALEECPERSRCRSSTSGPARALPMKEGRDHWWHELR